MSEELFALPGRTCVFDIDDFLHERKVRNANPDQSAGCYDSFDYATLFHKILYPASKQPRVEKVVRALVAEEDVYEDRQVRIDGPCVVIAEGIFLYRSDLPDVFDMKIWLEISEDEVIRRALGRSRKLAKHSDSASILARYNDRFIPAQRLHLARDNPTDRCDVIFEIMG
ncbi:MAG: hypothetical protein O7C73_07750 [Nitrospirae bacterium]|nr:hypothetical protein [Nitrospirota bacterium]